MMSKPDTTDRNTTAGHGTGSNLADARSAAGDARDYLREAAHSATDAAGLTYDELRTQVETLKGDLTGLMDAARAAGMQSAGDAYAGARRAGRRAAEVAEDGYEIAGERLDDAVSATEHFVRERPAVSLGLAAGSGFLLAMYLSRR